MTHTNPSEDHSPATGVANRANLQSVLHEAGKLILGKEKEIRLALACLLAKGHLLIEDLPGLGKTTLAHTLAKLLGLDFARIQFTSDLLPADILGLSIYERERGTFRFLPGPIFSRMILADEINRATPKTQSALLEAMEEHQVTLEGETRPLPQPFFVIATQNPAHQLGTFPLPESQLDRFLLRIELGYPDPAAERQLLMAGGHREKIDHLSACLTPEALMAHQKAVTAVFVAPALLDYLQALITATRHHPAFLHGLSPRAGLGLLNMAKAWAYLARRDSVLPDDIQTVFPGVALHRLNTRENGGHAAPEHIDQLIRSIPIP